MEIRDLYYLTVLAEEQNISKAAERLFLAQASLSQFLRQFESSLGSQIFVRTNRGIRPTPAGHVFLERVQQIQQDYRQAQQEFWDNESSVGGTVFFGISSFRGAYILPPVLKAFYQENPQVRINIFEGNSMELVPKIREGSLDLALSAYPVIDTDGIQIEYLFKDEVLLVATREHPIMEHARQAADGHYWAELESIGRYECIISEKDTMLGHLVRSTMGAAGINLFCRHDNITAAFAASMAREGLALAFTYRSCRVEREDAVYISLGEQGLYLRLALLMPNTDYRSKATLAFARLLRETLGEKRTERLS